MQQKIEKYYEYFLHRFTSKRNLSAKSQLRDEAIFVKFAKWCVDNTLNEHQIFDYLAFQFCYWHGTKTKMGTSYFTPSWILGKKAIERYQKDPGAFERKRRDLTTKFGIKISELYESKVSLDEQFELERQRFFNTAKGLFNCADFAVYDEKSNSCQKCDYVSYCKDKKINKDDVHTIRKRNVRRMLNN